MRNKKFKPGLKYLMGRRVYSRFGTSRLITIAFAQAPAENNLAHVKIMPVFVGLSKRTGDAYISMRSDPPFSCVLSKADVYEIPDEILPSFKAVYEFLVLSTAKRHYRATHKTMPYSRIADFVLRYHPNTQNIVCQDAYQTKTVTEYSEYQLIHFDTARCVLRDMIDRYYP